MALFHVRTPEEFKSALLLAKSGDRIELATGDYGDVAIHNRSFGDGIIIAAADPEHPPQINSMSLWNVHGLTLDGLSFAFTPTEKTMEWSSALRADQSSDITVVNSTFVGGNSIAGVSPDAEPGTQGASGILGLPIGRAMTFQNCQSIRVEENSIQSFSSGIRIGNVDGLEISYNEISDFRRVAIGGGDASNVIIAGNHLHDANPWKYGGLGDHGDFIHLWTTPNQGTPSENIVISDNFLDQADGTAIIGIYLDDNTNNIGYKGVSITGNVIANSNGQALRLENVRDLDIVENTILPTASDLNAIPRINIVKAEDVWVDQNLFAGVVGDALKDASGNEIRIGNNLSVQGSNPAEANFIGRLFVNGLAEEPSLQDLRIVPGSIAEGFGAQASRFSTTPGEIDLLLASTVGKGETANAYTFSLLEFLDRGELSSLDGAEVRWQFGDGNSGKGLTVSHVFEEGGHHAVKAEIRFANGETRAVERVVSVQLPEILSADFESPETSGAVALAGGAQLVQHDSGTAVQIGGDRSLASFGAKPGMVGNDAFTISFSFQKAEAAVGGRALYYSGTAVVDLEADGIVLRGRTDLGEAIVLRGTGVGIRDTEWHRVTYSFDSAAGKAALFVDGKEVASQDGLSGVQYTTPGHRLHLGNPFGESFSGLVDDVRFLQYAMSDGELLPALSEPPQPLPPPAIEISVTTDKPGGCTVTFDAVRVSGDHPEGTQYQWDFGDGNIATGPLVTHRYADEGTYSATLTVFLPDGRESMAGTTVSVESPDLVALQQNGSFVVQDGTGETVVAAAHVDPEGGVQLGNPGVTARIARDLVEPMLSDDSLSISFTLEADTPTAHGEVFRLHGSVQAHVTERGALAVRALTSEGEVVRLVDRSVDFRDQKSHDVEIRFEGGRMRLIVDQDLRAEADFSGTLGARAGHDLVFGNPWAARNFEGDLTAFAIDLDPTLLPDPFAGLMAACDQPIL